MQKTLFWFNLAMIVAYAAMGLFLIFAKNIQLLEPKYQTTLGIVVLLYAGFRLFTLIRKKKQIEKYK